MKLQWNHVLSVEHLESINCWATLEEMQTVIPFHKDRFEQIIINAKSADVYISASDLSFATAYVIALLFLEVKGTRPMTYIFLTKNMIKALPFSGGVIDQTKFKTCDKYAFDSIVITASVLTDLNDYIDYIRPKFQPTCNFLLLTRNGSQQKKISDIFARMVFLAIGKYIHPTRYRQIIETASIENLCPEDQEKVSRDQKHSSHVAKVHYQKLSSRKVAEEAKNCIDRLKTTINDDTERVIKSNVINTPAPYNGEYEVGECSHTNISSNSNIIDFATDNPCNEQDISRKERTNKSPIKSNFLHMDAYEFPAEDDVEVKDTIKKTITKPTIKKLKSQSTEVNNTDSSYGRQACVSFSTQEDGFLKTGIAKYGKRWTTILNQYPFRSSRTKSTLQKRAKVMKLV